MLVAARETHNVHSINLPTAKISADRSSPAFSAVEDALSIKEFTDEKKEEAVVPKLKLKGLKVLGHINGNLKKPVKLEKINLRGERIGVAHFTRKFINQNDSLKLVTLAAAPKVSLVQNTNHLVKKKLVVEGVTVENVRELSAADSEAPSVSINNITNVSRVKLKEPSLSVRNPVVPVLRGSFASVYEAVQLSGDIELEDASEIFGENLTYYISRSFDGQIFETGVVDAEKSKFKMEVGSVKGILLVELRTEDGKVLAYGEHSLPDTDDLNALKVKVYPSEALFSGRALISEESVEGAEVAASNALESVSGVDGALEVDGAGYYNEVLFDRGSSFVVETSSKDYWTDLKFGVAGKPLYPRLIRKDTFENFAKTLDPYGETIDVQNAIVGSVTQKGLPLENIKVSLLGNEHQKPVYFNNRGAADPKLQKTSVNGGFIFVNVSNGVHLVQAVSGNDVLSQKWYMAKDGRLSQGQINVGHVESLVASVESFPKRDNDEILSMQELGIDKQYAVSSGFEELIKLKTNSELLGLIVNPSDQYKAHVYITSSRVRKKSFKIIQDAWLNSFLNERRSNANRALGMVAGFITQNNFKIVKEATTALSSGSQIFYFDKQGRYVETGIAGGGFLITEVPSGLRSVVVSIKGKETFLNKVVLSQSRSLSIF